MCRKNVYPDKKAAVSSIHYRQTGNSRKHGRVKSLRAYYCERCRGWHLTSNDYVQERDQVLEAKEHRKYKHHAKGRHILRD